MPESGLWCLEVVMLIPDMIFHELIPDFGRFEVDNSFHIESSQDRVNLFGLFLSVNHSISTIELAHHKILLVPAELFQNVFISSFQHVLVIISFTNQQYDFVDHDSRLTSPREVYMLSYIHSLCFSKSGTLSTIKGKFLNTL